MNKVEKYQLLQQQIKALSAGETDQVAVMANVAAAIHLEMGFWWTGFYRVQNGELVLGPFQGPVACMHIGYGVRSAEGEIIAVLDIDSKDLATFDEVDKQWLEEIVKVFE